MIRGAPSEVVVGTSEGLKRDSAINLDHVQTVDRDKLSTFGTVGGCGECPAATGVFLLPRGFAPAFSGGVPARPTFEWPRRCHPSGARPVAGRGLRAPAKPRRGGESPSLGSFPKAPATACGSARRPRA